MKKTYYLQEVKLVRNNETASAYYECLYSNGLTQVLDFIAVNAKESINIPTILFSE
jgi:hypothetical protein